MLFGLDLCYLKQEYDVLVGILSSDQALDRSRRAEIQRKVAVFQEVISALSKYESLVTEKNQYVVELEALSDADEYKSLLVDEIKRLESELKKVEEDLEEFLFPPDVRDSKSCYIEIRAGAGGQEASIFASDLLKMYTAYALKRGWEASVNSMSTTDLGGVREVILYVKGKLSFGSLKYESGVHRVQRVPVTEASGRIHTSTVTVAVMSEADEIDVKIDPGDIRVDVFRSSGAGGQHVNTTDSAVRITHIPTGVVVTCQDERSQIKNRAKALKELRSRILEAEMQKAEAQRSSERKSKVGSGDRAEKIRTYNYPQNRVTDHRIDLTLKKLDMIMEGDLFDLLEALKSEAKVSKSISPEYSFLFVAVS